MFSSNLVNVSSEHSLAPANPFRLCLPSCASAPLSQTRLLLLVCDTCYLPLRARRPPPFSGPGVLSPQAGLALATEARASQGAQGHNLYEVLGRVAARRRPPQDTIFEKIREVTRNRHHTILEDDTSGVVQKIVARECGDLCTTSDVALLQTRRPRRRKRGDPQ